MLIVNQLVTTNAESGTNAGWDKINFINNKEVEITVVKIVVKCDFIIAEFSWARFYIVR